MIRNWYYQIDDKSRVVAYLADMGLGNKDWMIVNSLGYIGKKANPPYVFIDDFAFYDRFAAESMRDAIKNYIAEVNEILDES